MPERHPRDHRPASTGFELLHHLAGMEAVPDPTQADLDAMLAAASAMVA